MTANSSRFILTPFCITSNIDLKQKTEVVKPFPAFPFGLSFFRGCATAPLLFHLLQHDAEAHAAVALAAQAVGLLHIGAPAVNAADTARGAQHRNAGAAGFGQLAEVLRGFDLLRRVGQRAEGKRLAGLLDRQGLAVGQLQAHLLGVHVQAAILRHQRRLDVRGFRMAAEHTALIAVRVGLARKARPAGADHGGGRLKLDAEAGQLGRAGHCMVDGLDLQSPLCLDRVGHLDKRAGHAGHAEAVLHPHALLGFFLHGKAHSLHKDDRREGGGNTADPADYSPLVNRLKGQVIKISPNSTQFINPMDINANYSEEDNPLSLKADFILSLCELVVGGKEGLLPVEKTVIDRCVHLIYRKYFADPCPENMPILEDLYNALLQQDEKEAHHVATALEIYVKGSLNLFNHRTNVNVNNRIVCYDIKELGKQMKKLGMLIVQDQVWGRVTANRSSGKSTRYYMDEMHLLLKEEQTAAYSVEIWKRFRKWGGIPTGLTQNVKDLLSSREVENIFENSDMIIMLNQAAGDRQILAKQLNISPHQLSYVTHSGEGEGLLFFGNVILPFVDRFPTNLELYRIMTTKLGEVSEGAQK